MQFQAFLDKNCLTIPEVAKAWGMDASSVWRAAKGKRWPSADIMIKAYRLSNGAVGFIDWIETNRTALVTAGTIDATEFPNGTKAPQPRKRKSRRSRQRQQEGVQDAAA